MINSGLAGLRVVIVEDVSLVTMLLEDLLVEWGCAVVAIVSELEGAEEKLTSIAFDLVVLDINLNGAHTFGIAQWLTRRRIPFVFSTGYPAAGIPEKFRQVPLVGKPFERNELQLALVSSLTATQTTRSP